MEFSYQMMSFECSCGEKRSHVKVGLSSLGELMCKWTCIKCHSDIIARIPFEQLIRDTPVHHEKKLLASPLFNKEDKDFLRAMKIAQEGI